MKDKIAAKETVAVGVGEALLSGATVGIFALLGYFRQSVLWSALVGCFVATVNYFLMAITVSAAAKKAVRGDVQSARKMIQLSSVLRLAAMGAILAICLKLGASPLALLLPLLFTRPILLLREWIGKGSGYERH